MYSEISKFLICFGLIERSFIFNSFLEFFEGILSKILGYNIINC